MLLAMERRRVLLTFLGIGRPKRNESSELVDATYDDALYCRGAVEARSRYVQAALLSIERQRGVQFDEIIIAVTPTSRTWHWEKAGRLRDELTEEDRAKVRLVEVSEDLGVDAQWEGFGRLLEAIPDASTLHVDMTHGYRIIPILFSVAVELLTRVKDVELAQVFYGAYETGNPRSEIVEVSRFFQVTRWAEAVRAISEDVNPDKLAALASSPHGVALGGLADPRFVEAMERLAAVVKNADAEHAAATFEDGLAQIGKIRADAKPVTRAMLDLLEDKFGTLHRAGGTKRFTPPWYETQIVLAQVMIQHGLLMQGLTILQELTTSVCEELCRRALRSPDNPVAIELRARGSGKFKKKWEHVREMGESLSVRLRLKAGDPLLLGPVWDKDDKVAKPLVEGIFAEQFAAEYAEGRFAFLVELGALRNSFNHAWMNRGSSAAPAEVRANAERLAGETTSFVRTLLESDRIGGGAFEER